MPWSPLKQQKQLPLPREVFTFPGCSTLPNILLIWLYSFTDPTEYRKDVMFKARGWLDMAPQAVFQVTFTALTEPV